MKRVLTAAAVLTVMSGTALAEPAKITDETAEPMRLEDAQMDGVTAGLLDNFNIGVAVPVTVVNAVTLATAIGVLAEGISADAVSDIVGGNVIDLSQMTQ